MPRYSDFPSSGESDTALETPDRRDERVDEEQRALRAEVAQLREQQRRLEEQLAKRDPPREQAAPDAPPPAPEPGDRRSFAARHPVALVAGLLLLGALIVGGWFLLGYLHSYEATDDAQIDGHLNAVSSRISGNIAAVYVQENQFVKKGQVLCEIDPRDYKVALDQAGANLAQARADIQAENPNVAITATTSETSVSSGQADVAVSRAALAGAQGNYEAALARVREAEANNAKAQADVVRYQALVEKDEIPRQQFDAAVAAAKAMAATVESARAQASALQKVIDEQRSRVGQAQTRVQEVNRNAPRELAIRRANVASKEAGAIAAKAQLDQAALNLQYTKILAPVDGVVGKKGVEVGMRVAPGQDLMAIVPLEDIWVTANFKETQLRNMRPRQRATIEVDAFGKTYDGYVESLSAASGARYSMLPPENATGNYVKVVQRIPVRIRFNPDQDPDHRLRPGMSVNPKVWIK